jgi:hypothetical protein
LLTELALAPVSVWLAVGAISSAYTLIGGAAIVAAITCHALSVSRRLPRIRHS